eukprot:m.156637 g.156637  ORF g.156637 m.156637 type:complete len:69 (-) comp23632_c0_seq1:204-410(-)
MAAKKVTPYFSLQVLFSLNIWFFLFFFILMNGIFWWKGEALLNTRRSHLPARWWCAGMHTWAVVRYAL